MPRKRTKSDTEPAKKESAEKGRVELRFEQHVLDELKSVADQSQITVNQLIQSFSKKFLSHAHSGEPRRDEDGKIYNKPEVGCVWFGEVGTKPDEGDEAAAFGMDMSLKEFERKYLKGKIWMELDFTERRVVKRD